MLRSLESAHQRRSRERGLVVPQPLHAVRCLDRGKNRVKGTGVIMRVILSVAVLLFASIPVHAQTARVDRVDVVDYGIYQTEMTKQTSTPGVVAGTVRTLTNIKNSEVTRTIPAQPGVRFGFRYNVIGAPNGAQVSMTVVHRFPKQGLRRPGTAETVYREEYVAAKTIGHEGYTDYGFDHDWELVPGAWTIELWYQGRKLAEQSFTVVKPQ